jgi:serine/threonine protein kinase
MSLDGIGITTLKKIAKDLKIPKYTSFKSDTRDILAKKIIEKADPEQINIYIVKYSKPSKKKIDITQESPNWVALHQLGKRGKEGKIYYVVDTSGHGMAMKVFRKNKNPDAIKKEVNFQIISAESKYRLSPRVVEYDINKRYIIMEKLDKTLVDIIEEQKGKLTLDQQKKIISLFVGLDALGIFHNDANPLNIMTRGDKWYVIDFGFSCRCDHKDIVNVEFPNVQFMTVGLVSWFVDNGYDPKTYPYLLKFLNKRIRKKLFKEC